MKKNWLRRGLAGLLTVLLLSQGMVMTTLAAYSPEDKDLLAAEPAAVTASAQLQSGTAVIPQGSSE